MGVNGKPAYRLSASKSTFAIGSDVFTLSVAQYRLMEVLIKRPHDTIRPSVLADLASTSHGNLSGNMSRIMTLLRQGGYASWVVHVPSKGYRFIPYGEDVESPSIEHALEQLSDLDETGKVNSLLQDGYSPAEVALALSLSLGYVSAIENYMRATKTRGLNGPSITLPPLRSLFLE